MTSKRKLVCLLAFAIARDLMCAPFMMVVEKFESENKEIMRQLFINTEEELYEFLIWDLQQDVKAGHSYGKLDKDIMRLY